jgi:hypothetical protein
MNLAGSNQPPEVAAMSRRSKGGRSELKIVVLRKQWPSVRTNRRIL